MSIGHFGHFIETTVAGRQPGFRWGNLEGLTNDPAGQFHFDPATYMEMILAEVPAYVALQDAAVRETADIPTSQILELQPSTRRGHRAKQT